MMEDKDTTVGIEHIKKLCDFAINNISKHHKNFLVTKKVILIKGDRRKGCPEYGPYDCIHVGAAAEQLLQPLIDQLKNGGRLVIPVGEQDGDQYINIIDKDNNGKITIKKTLGVSYVPLTSVNKQLSEN